MISSGVKDRWVVGRKDIGCFPIETILFSLGWLWTNEAALTSPQINAPHAAILTFEIDLVFVRWINSRDESIASADIEPI